MSRSDRPRRLLMIAPAFYPCAGSGAHRSSKFCKYLSELGYETVVVSRDSRAGGWPVDEDLLKQLPESTEIRRTFTPWSPRLEGVLRVMRTLARGLGLRKGGSRSQTSAGETRRWRYPWWDKWLALPDRAVYWVPGAVAATLNPARRADQDDAGKGDGTGTGGPG